MRAKTIARRLAVLLFVALVAAGCAVPQESGPTDMHQDADHDGVPDGNSAVPGTNETEEEIDASPDDAPIT